LELGVEDCVAEIGAVGEQEGDGEHEGEEVEVIVAADAVVDPDAVVVGLLDAGVADAAVFAAGGFGQVAGAAGLGGEGSVVAVVVVVILLVLLVLLLAGVGAAVEDGVVVGVSVHCDMVVLRRDGGRGETGEVEEYVGWGGEDGDQDEVEGEEES
jgi:uncharacterized membrane protein